jgi:putative chitinase
MQIKELDSYNLGDAVRFHDELNPALWDGMKMRPEVRTALLKIAHDFREFMGINDLALKDITVSGSNAAFSYTPHSDIDLHLVVDMDQLDPDEVYRELFNAKKYQYNDQHDIKIRGYDVELYVQDAAQPHVSLGEYSLINDDWTHIPVKRRANLDDGVTKNKYEKLGNLIELALNSSDLKMVETVKNIIKRYRQAGLDEHGEFGPENLAFKILRSQGAIQQLFNHLNALKDQELSLKEKAPAHPVVYGYKTLPNVNESPDGTGPSTAMFLTEKEPMNMKEIVQDFVDYCVAELKIDQAPNLKIRHDPQWSKINHTFGKYTPDNNVLQIGVANRHIMDILRTVAHELTHQRQHEVQDVPPDAGNTGSSHENVANAMAGILMRNYGKMHPEHFIDAPLDEETLGSSTLSAMENNQDLSEVRLRPKLTKFLRDQGYKQVGQGADKTVWTKDQGPAILILMPEEHINSAAPLALRFLKFSLDNPNNPFLPKFVPMKDPVSGDVSRVSSFNFDDEKYYQIAVEKLLPLRSKFWDEVIEEIDVHLHRRSWPELLGYLQKYPGVPVNQKILSYMKDAESKNKIHLLFTTIQKLHAIGNKNNYDMDIRPANIMQRQDGTPVFIDPWYTSKISPERLSKKLYHQTYAKEDAVEEGWKETAVGLGLLAGLGAPSTLDQPKNIAPTTVSGAFVPASKSLTKVKKVDPVIAKQVLVTKAQQAGIHGRELQHLVSQAAHETLNFKKMVEMGNPEKFAQYEKISSLGNVEPGDGERYRGRGYLQITGRYNYQKFGKMLNLPLEEQPELLENPEIAADAAIAYWKNRVRPKVKNWHKATVKQVTKPINPKLAGLKSRSKQFGMAKSLEESASGYIPTRKQAQDPRFKMALTKDIKPGEVGRQANKFKLNVDSQGHPDLLDKNLQNLLKEYAEFQRLDEVGMRPTELEAWARSPEAQGVVAGFEAEVIFNDVRDTDLEPNYDEDREPADIDDICSFFEDGDMNSSSDIRRLRRQLQDEFADYYHETQKARWNSDEGSEFLSEYAEERFREKREIENILLSQELTQETISEILKNPDSDEYKNARDAAWETFLEEVKEDAYTDFLEDLQDNDDMSELEHDFLRDEGIRMMSDVSNSYNIQWPYNSVADESSPDWGETQHLAKQLSKIVGKDVIPGKTYGAVPRGASPNSYILEPDSSLDPDNDEDAGLEIISPPQALGKTLEDLGKVFDFAKNYGYTNRSTGLHMNVSVPNMQNLDYTKLVLFAGDLHVLEQYKRTNNQYCKSVFMALKNKLDSLTPETIKQTLEQIKNVLDNTAEKIIGSDIQQNKYVSIHQKEGYIEFRSPGNDYLEKPYQELVSTMLRFARALTIACNPNLYREEYSKKLYKFLSSSVQSTDELAVFVQYKLGTLNKEDLKYMLQKRNVARKSSTDTKEYIWSIIKKSTNEEMDRFTATKANADEAFESWLQNYGVLTHKNKFFYEPAMENFKQPQPTTASKSEPQAANKTQTNYVPGTNYIPGSTMDIQQRRLAGQTQPGETA